MSPPEQAAASDSQLGDHESGPPKPDVPVIMAGDPSAGDADAHAAAPSLDTATPQQPESDLQAKTTTDSASQSQTQSQNLIDLADPIPEPPTTDASEAPARPSTPPNKGKQPLEAHVEDVDASTSSTVAAQPVPVKPLEGEGANPQLLGAEPSSYVDPTPPTPMASQPPSRRPSSSAGPRTSEDRSPSRFDPENDDKRYTSEDEQERGPKLELQSIMQQFNEVGGGPGAEEVMSPRLEIASPMLGSPVTQHPPRKSSLEPLNSSIAEHISQFQGLRVAAESPADGGSSETTKDGFGPPVPPKDGTFGTPSRPKEDRTPNINPSSSPPASIHRPPPPEPEPEPALPFDFHRFLEQLRNKKADPVARYLKSFLSEFGKKQWMVHEQVKIIGDFLAFIANKMMLCEVWAQVSDAEFDNAREGMEKLVMNRLYSQTFSPAIPSPKPIPGGKPKRKGGDPPLGPGRRGQHQEDVERDDIIAQKINIYGWVKEEHLDIPPIGDSGKRFLKLAQQELLKIKSYRAPRDKIICVLNCCKVIFGLLKHTKSDSSADSFMPMLIYVVLQANPEHLVSNVQYILRFRNQDKLGGEAGYYLSSLMGAIQFVENMDRTTLTITDDEFEKNVEAAVSAIAEKHNANSPSIAQQPTFNEKSAYLHPSSSSARPSLDGSGPSQPRRSISSDGGYDDSETLPIGGLLKSIQKPLSTIGRMFSDDAGQSSSQGPASAPRSPRGPSPHGRPEAVGDGSKPSDSRPPLSAEEAAARQASAETAEAQRLSRAEHSNVVETLAGMFPDLDKDIISDVVHQKQGRVGLAVDACLALSS